MPRGDEPLGAVANQFLFENDRLKMWHLNLQPGESSDWHVHDLDYVTVVVEPGKLLREWEDESTDEMENPLGHVTLRNMVPTELPMSAPRTTVTLWPSSNNTNQMVAPARHQPLAGPCDRCLA